MKSTQLDSDNTVIPLAGLIITTAIISGSINAAFVTWKHNQSWWLTLIAFFISAIACWFISKQLTSFVFSTVSDNQTFVVKAGKSALPSTLKAAMIGSALGLALAGLVLSFVIGGTSLISSTWVVVSIISCAVGILWGIVSAII